MNVFKCLSCGGTYIAEQLDGTRYFHVCGPLPANKDGVQLEIPDKRDESPDVGSLRQLIGIKAEGKGVKCLTDEKLAEPEWITALYDRIDKQQAK